MAILVVLLSALIVVISGFYSLFKFKFQYWATRGVPYLEPKIPFGTLRRGGKQRHFKDILEETYREFKGKVPFAGMYFFTKPCALIIDLNLAHHVLVKDFSKFQDRGIYCNQRDDPLSANLLNLEGQKWKALRSKLTPTFTSGKMKFMFPTIVQVMNQFNHTLKEIIKTDSEVEIKDLLARFTTDVIGTCAFGIECNSLKDPNTEFRRFGKIALEKPRNGVIGHGLINLFPKLALKLRMKTMQDDVTGFFLKVVRETVEYRERNNVRRNDFMDILIQLKNGKKDGDTCKDSLGKMSFEEIAAQVFIFFLGGFETSSTNMTYSLYELAMNPDIQEKARREVNDILAKYGGELTYDAMMEMTFIEQIINESVRKYPIIFYAIRRANCDFQVPDSNMVIEKDARVFIPFYCIHHDEKIYQNPDVFDPDRFTQEEMRKRHPMAFLGFGDGPRNCIGARFGQMQAKIGLVSLLKNYRFKTCSRTPEKLEYSLNNVILVPVGGLWLNVEAIE